MSSTEDSSSVSDSESLSSSGELPLPQSSEPPKVEKQQVKSTSSTAPESTSSGDGGKKKDLPKRSMDDSADASRPKISKTTSMMPSVGKTSTKIKTTQSSVSLKKDKVAAAASSGSSKGALSTMRVSDKEKNVRKAINSETNEVPLEKLTPISSDVTGKIDKLKEMGEEDAPDDQNAPYVDNPAPQPRRKKHRLRVVGDASRVPSIKLTIGGPDGSSLAFTANTNFTGKELYHSVADKLGLWQDELFALALTDSSSSVRFLDWAAELGDQGIKDGMKLHFLVRYGKTPFRWADSVAAKFFATAMNALIASGRLHVASKQAIQMAALQVVIRFGSGVAKTKTSFLTQELLSQFLPPEIMASTPLDYLQQRVLFYYRKFTEKKHEHVVFDAAVRYNEMGREFCLGWGAHMLSGTVGSEMADLGLVEDGLIFRPKNAQTSETAFIPLHQAEVSHEKSSTTLKFKHAGEKYKFECSSAAEAGQFNATAQSLYYILAKQGVEHYSAGALPSEDTPYYVNYTKPVDRKKQAEHLKPSKSSKKASLLSVFQQAYIKKCQSSQVKPLNRLLLQLDTKLDQGEVHDCLDLRRCNLDDAALSVVFEAVQEVMALVSSSKSEKKYKKDFDPKKLLVSANERLDSSQSICKLMALCGLTTIDAADCSLSADAARNLATCLKQTSTLEELILDRNLDVTASGIKNLLDVLRSQPQFKSLSLACCGITKDAEDDLKQFFEHSKSIQSVNLSDNKIGDAPMQTILRAAEKAKGTLISLNFTNTAMGKKSADALKVFLEGEDKISIIKIGYNTFPSSVGRVIADIIPEGDILEELDISSIGIGSKATSPIITALASNKTIKRLNLSGNHIEKDLSDALEQLLTQNDHIEYLSLRNCSLDKLSMIKIAKAVTHNKTLRELDLSGNRLDSIEALESWTTALIANTSLKTVYFAACKMDAACCEAFAEVIGENKTLERLHLDGNYIGKGVAYLADGLAQNRTLRFLTLQEASLRQDYLEEFLKRFSGSSGLELLDVRRNKFKDVASLQKLADKFSHLDLKF